MIAIMTKDEIIQLSDLSRITLTDTEVSAFQSEIDAILAYVSTIQEIAGADLAGPTVLPVHNVLRPDAVTNEPGAHTDTLLAAAPHTQGKFIAVKKILKQTE